MLSARETRICAWVVAEEIARRQRNATPIPEALKTTHAALLRELSACGQVSCQTGPAPTELVTTTVVAKNQHVSARTIRRRAAKEGAPMIAGRYVFSEGQT